MTEISNNSSEIATISPSNTASQPELVTISFTGGIDGAMSQLISINEHGILHEPTCLICSAPYRDDIELKFEEMGKDLKDHKILKQFIKDKTGITITKEVIINHFKQHYEGVREIQKVEYANRIKRISSIERTTLDRIALGLAAVEERLMGINSIVADTRTSASDVESIKSSETSKLMNSYNQLLKLKASILGEMKNNGEVVTIPRNAFVEVFNKALIESTDDQKVVVRKILEKLAQLSNTVQ
jgi:hypothetical protein